MSLDNENIKTILEIIMNNHVLMLNIINKEKKPIPEPVVTGNKEENEDLNKLNKKNQEDILEKAKKIITDDKKSIHSNGWITHVKEYAKIHNISYKEALSKASSTYKKK
jgi:hypothetical protein